MRTSLSLTEHRSALPAGCISTVALAHDINNHPEDLRREYRSVRIYRANLRRRAQSLLTRWYTATGDLWGTRPTHITAATSPQNGSSAHYHRQIRAVTRARPLSRERSKSKPTSQPIVNTSTTGEFNSIRTRSSNCSIVRHRIPWCRASLAVILSPCLPLLLPFSLSIYLSPPLSEVTLSCNPQHPPSYPLSSRLNSRAHTFARRNAHRPSYFPPPSLLRVYIYLPIRFYPTSLAKADIVHRVRKVCILHLEMEFECVW